MPRLHWSVVLFLLLLLPGCSWFPHDTPILKASERHVVITIITSAQANLNLRGVASPVKTCVIEVSRDPWAPPQLGNGRVCSDIEKNDEVLSVEEDILLPYTSWTYERSVPQRASRWYHVGAEFSHAEGHQSTFEIALPNNATTFRVLVFVDAHSLHGYPFRLLDPN